MYLAPLSFSSFHNPIVTEDIITLIAFALAKKKRKMCCNNMRNILGIGLSEI